MSTAADAPAIPHPLDFFRLLQWLDGRPLLDTIEPYRRAIFDAVLATFDPDGSPRYSLSLCGRAKKELEIGRPLPCRALQVSRMAIPAR